MLRVSVRLAGDLARTHGPRRELELPDGATVAELLARFPGLPAVRVARGGELVADDAPLSEGDQLAVVAPVAGG